MIAGIEAIRGLSGSAQPGAVTVTVSESVNNVPQFRAGAVVVLSPYSIDAELRTITSSVNKTITLDRPLAHAHTNGKRLFAITRGGLIPWSWWGGAVNDDGAASNNVLGFNRLTTEIRDSGIGAGIFVDGSFSVDNELQPYESQVVAGLHVFSARIQAVASFPFDDTGNVAIIHPRRSSGGPVLFEQPGPSGRWWFRNLYVDGRNLPNSNGILSSPQQPDSTENIRIQGCAGKYGLCLSDVQYHDVRNIQFDRCATSLYLWNARFVRVYNMNFTTPVGNVGVKIVNGGDSSFYGGLFETVPSPGRVVEATGGASRLGFYDIYTSGFSGGTVGDVFYFDAQDNPTGKCTYIITNLRCGQNSETVNLVRDVQRGIAISSLSAQRAIPLCYAHRDVFFAP